MTNLVKLEQPKEEDYSEKLFPILKGKRFVAAFWDDEKECWSFVIHKMDEYETVFALTKIITSLTISQLQYNDPLLTQ